MAVVALASVKAAPGVTTAALALGAVWPADRPVVVAELDPAGGDVSARFGLPPEPSIVTLAAAVRETGSSRTAHPLLQHCQTLPGGLAVLVSPPSPGQVRVPLDMLADVLPVLSVEARVDVVADCGRLEPSTLLATVGDGGVGERALGTPVTRVLQRADIVLIVTRGEMSDLYHIDAWFPALRSLHADLALLLVGRCRYPASEVAQSLGIELICELPMDSAGATVAGGRGRGGRPARLPLFRAARTAVDRLAPRLPSIVNLATGVVPPAASDVPALLVSS